MSQKAYDKGSDLQIKEPVEDATSENGVRLGDKSTIKTKGGTCFIIDVGDIFGPQWFSILPTLSSDLVLGMDFWSSFKVRVDMVTRTWTFEKSQFSYPLSSHYGKSTKLEALSMDENSKLNNFLKAEFTKMENETTGVTDLIQHTIELIDHIPHRQKPYRRSEAVWKFIDEEVDRLLEKGYVTWSNRNCLLTGCCSKGERKITTLHRLPLSKPTNS